MVSTQAFPRSPGSAETDGSVSLEPWARMLVDAGGVGPGDRVLDVACGTGMVSRIAADRVGARGSVVGLDRNPAMLAVAERLHPDIGRSFDVVLCRAALTCFTDPR